jgi:hypothetical protein
MARTSAKKATQKPDATPPVTVEPNTAAPAAQGGGQAAGEPGGPVAVESPGGGPEPSAPAEKGGGPEPSPPSPPAPAAPAKKSDAGIRVRCDLPNAGEMINGVSFARDGNAMVSEPVSEEVAKRFCSIPGYSKVK